MALSTTSTAAVTVQPVSKEPAAVPPSATGDAWLLSAFALAAAGKMTKKQLRRFRRKLVWESIKQKFKARNKASGEKIQWGLLIFCGILFVGLWVFAIAAGFAGILLKIVGIFLLVCLGIILL